MCREVSKWLITMSCVIPTAPELGNLNLITSLRNGSVILLFRQHKHNVCFCLRTIVDSGMAHLSLNHQALIAQNI